MVESRLCFVPAAQKRWVVSIVLVWTEGGMAYVFYRHFDSTQRIERGAARRQVEQLPGDGLLGREVLGWQGFDERCLSGVV